MGPVVYLFMKAFRILLLGLFCWNPLVAFDMGADPFADDFGSDWSNFGASKHSSATAPAPLASPEPAPSVSKQTSSVSKQPEPAKAPKSKPVRQARLPQETQPVQKRAAVQISEPAADAVRNYELCPSDVVRLEVFREPDLQKEARVSADGSIILPLVGKIWVVGRALSEVEAEVEERYDAEFLVNPQVSLHVVEYAERKVQVLGQVNDPGFVVIPPEREMNVAEAISGAGGLNLRAKSSGIEVIRKRPDGSTETLKVSLQDALKNPRKNIKLKSGDTVFVPESIF